MVANYFVPRHGSQFQMSSRLYIIFSPRAMFSVSNFSESFLNLDTILQQKANISILLINATDCYYVALSIIHIVVSGDG